MPPTHVVDQWSGRHACALQFALRMTHEDMADFLGVGKRTVAAWHERPSIVLRAELQRALDTAYEGSSEAVKVRFARQMRADDAADVDDASGRGQALTLSVAIAVVVNQDDVLLVCRRGEDSDGLTWQFPAGIVKPGSSSSTVAVRETLAETAVHCTIRERLGDRVHPLTNVYCEYFLCDYLTGDVENCDTSENISALWAPRADLTRYIPADRLFSPILEAIGEN